MAQNVIDDRNVDVRVPSPTSSCETIKMCYEDGDKASKTTVEEKTEKTSSREKIANAETGSNVEIVESLEIQVTAADEKNIDETSFKKSESPAVKNTTEVWKCEGNRPVPEPRQLTGCCHTSTKHTFSQGQIDSYTARVLAMEKSLGSSEPRSETRPTGRIANQPEARPEVPRALATEYSYLKCEQPRARSPSVPNTLTLGEFSDDISPSGSRKVVSPLLELRRPHCTLNCENCKAILEERFRHSRCRQGLIFFNAHKKTFISYQFI